MMKARTIFKALSDNSRFDMVLYLGQKDHSVDELRKKLDISQSSTSQHLKILYDAGLVSYAKYGNFRTYSLKKDALKEAMRFFDYLWDEGLQKLKLNLENGN